MPSLTALLSPRFRRHWRLLLWLLTMIVSWFAFKPNTGEDIVVHVDKLRHVFAFATLAAVAALGWPPGVRQSRLIAIGLLAYGLAIELVQSQLPTRSASVADWMMDGVGVALGLLLMQRLRRQQK